MLKTHVISMLPGILPTSLPFKEKEKHHFQLILKIAVNDASFYLA